MIGVAHSINKKAKDSSQQKIRRGNAIMQDALKSIWITVLQKMLPICRHHRGALLENGSVLSTNASMAVKSGKPCVNHVLLFLGELYVSKRLIGASYTHILIHNIYCT
jgi:hypothetical protein